MKIKIKYFNGAKRLEKISKGDWIDVYANDTMYISQNSKALIPLGIAMELPEGYEAHLAPRSSTFKKWGIMQTNHQGVVDNTYCGDDDWWFMSCYATKDIKIEKGDRICQFRIMKKMPKIKFETVEILGNKNRGGFGSTGK